MGMQNFKGTTKPTNAEAWLKEVALIFDNIGTPMEYRVKFATFYLKKVARHWWKTLGHTHNVHDLTWDQFEFHFKKTYANAEYGTAMMKEFGNKLQGDMIVAEYYVRFIEWSCYMASMNNNVLER